MFRLPLRVSMFRLQFQVWPQLQLVKGGRIYRIVVTEQKAQNRAQGIVRKVRHAAKKDGSQQILAPFERVTPADRFPVLFDTASLAMQNRLQDRSSL